MCTCKLLPSFKCVNRNFLIPNTTRCSTYPCRDAVAAHNGVLSEHARHERKHGVEPEVLLDDGFQVLGVVEHARRGGVGAGVEALQLVVEQALLVGVARQVVEREQRRVGRLKKRTQGDALLQVVQHT